MKRIGWFLFDFATAITIAIVGWAWYFEIDVMTVKGILVIVCTGIILWYLPVTAQAIARSRRRKAETHETVWGKPSERRGQR